MKIFFDPDIPESIRDEIAALIKEQITSSCKCGCDEIYVSMTDNILDVKCYDCGESFFEVALEAEEESQG
ncbi:hypothetical protein [Thermosulfuriphilus sp.]